MTAAPARRMLPIAGLGLLLLAGGASASTRRLALVIGSNAGAAPAARLHFAEADAEKIARVLTELGGVEPGDLLLLRSPTLAAVRNAFSTLRTRARTLRQSGARAVLVFYFSGHSDGVALELGSERLEFSELRGALDGSDADVRVAIVDSCRSGALLAARGGTAGPAFQIRLADDVASTGSVFLTSSAADELALESREVGGGLFTHHLVSALRGAADVSGDGQITLAEAYQYTFRHTLLVTAATFVGGQHPAFDFRLSGQGELVLTQLAQQSAVLALPAGLERAVISRLSDATVVAETSGPGPVRIALAPGDYEIHAMRAQRSVSARAHLTERQVTTVSPSELQPGVTLSGALKGDSPGWLHDVTVGASGAFAWSPELGAMAQVAASIEAGGAIGPAVRLGYAHRGDPGLEPTQLDAWVGIRWRERRGRLGLSFGFDAGVAWVGQQLSGRWADWSVGPGLAGVLTGSIDLGHHLALVLELRAPALLLTFGAGPGVTVQPTAALGLAYSLP